MEPQNQAGNHPRRWERTGIVVETKDHDQYNVGVDGTGRLTLRNRRFLRNFTPIFRSPPTTTPQPTNTTPEPILFNIVKQIKDIQTDLATVIAYA